MEINYGLLKKKQKDIEDIKDVLSLEDKMSYETIKPKIQKYRGCKSCLCHSCKNYYKFLSVSTMHVICWNKGCFYET